MELHIILHLFYKSVTLAKNPELWYKFYRLYTEKEKESGVKIK